MAQPSTDDEAIARRYVRGIRNKAKRDYAERYLAWLLNGEEGPEPDSTGLSYMGAQAVRLTLAQALA